MKIVYPRYISRCLLFLSVIAITTGCKKSPASSTVAANIPVLATTNVIINLTSTSAQSGGVIISRGFASITANGVCYSSTNQTPTISDSKTTDSVNTSGATYTSFASKMTNLTPNTTYYLRAYATNIAGTGYGGVITFKTPVNSTGVSSDVSTFAGTGVAGYIDGAGPGAMFNNPQGVSVDSNGNVYVSDSFNDLIRGITAAGNVGTIAGNQTIGYTNGPGLSAQFYSPSGSAVDAQGNIYVADQGNNVIRKITPAGVVSLFAGRGGVAGYRNGAKDSSKLTGPADTLALFNSPQGVAVDASGNIYVADRGNNAIREIFPTGRTRTLAGNKVKGFRDATGSVAFFNNPSGVAVDAGGNLYVTDLGNNALRKVTQGGVVTTIVGNPAQSSLLGLPAAITIDSKGNLYIVDEGGRILIFTTNSVLYVIAGISNSAGLVNGAGTVAQFNYPQGIAIDANGNIYVADQYNNCIRKIVVTIGVI